MRSRIANARFGAGLLRRARDGTVAAQDRFLALALPCQQALPSKRRRRGESRSSPATCEDELRILQQMLNCPDAIWAMIPITSERLGSLGSFGAMLGSRQLP